MSLRWNGGVPSGLVTIGADRSTMRMRASLVGQRLGRDVQQVQRLLAQRAGAGLARQPPLVTTRAAGYLPIDRIHCQVWPSTRNQATERIYIRPWPTRLHSAGFSSL